MSFLEIIMPTIKEAKFKITSVIENLDDVGLPEGDSERTESAAVGYFHCFDGYFLLTYTESQEGVSVTTEIKCDSDTVRVLRHGAIESDMMFSVGVTHKSVYTVSPYKFDAEVRARRIRSSLGESGGRLELIYDMKIGGASKSARMSVEVIPS